MDGRLIGGELESKAGDTRTAGAAKVAGLGADLLDRIGRRVPRLGTVLAEQAHGERGSAEDTDAVAFEVRQQIRKRPVEQSVVAVREYQVERSAVEHIAIDPERQSGDADEAYLSLLLCLAKRWNGLFHHLLERAEFDIVALHDVEDIESKPLETRLDAWDHASSGEVEIGRAVTAQFGCEQETVARDAFEHAAEVGFGAGFSVEGGSVDEVDAGVEGGVQSAVSDGVVHVAVHTAKWGPAESQNRNAKTCFSEDSIPHQMENCTMSGGVEWAARA